MTISQHDFPQDQDAIHAVEDDDVDSAYSESDKTDTTSLRSWILEYRVENGRTYHSYKDGSYWGANDEAALEHLDIGHSLYTMSFGGRLFLAPIDREPQNILDLGTGTGIWAIDVADEFPSAIVIGTDLSPTQPTWVPSNCQFMVDDMEADFCWEEGKFDFIHVRGLHGTIRDWPRLYSQCLRALRPGGYLEHSEYSAQFTTDDNTIPENSGIAAWNKVGPECHEVMKTELQVLETMGQEMQEAGFVDIEEMKFKWPIGPWAKKRELRKLGKFCRAHVDTGLENWTLRLLTSVLGWTAEEVYVLCASVRQDFNDPKIHSIHQMRTVYGRRPLE